MDWLMSVIVAVGVVSAASIIAWAVAPKGWRTVVANAAAGVLVFAGPAVGDALHYLSGVPWHDVTTDKPTAIATTFAVIVMNGMWRKFTTTPMGRPR